MGMRLVGWVEGRADRARAFPYEWTPRRVAPPFWRPERLRWGQRVDRDDLAHDRVHPRALVVVSAGDPRLRSAAELQCSRASSSDSGICSRAPSTPLVRLDARLRRRPEPRNAARQALSVAERLTIRVPAASVGWLHGRGGFKGSAPPKGDRMRRVVLAVLVASSAVAACAHEPTTPGPVEPEVAPIATVTSATTVQTTPIEEAPAPREDGRLPALATPSHYAITLDIDPTQQRFHGTVSIDIDVAHPTAHIILHGRDLTITDVGATFGSKAIGGTSTTRAPHGGTEPEELVLIFPEPLPKGRATISLTYDAPFAADLSGLYRVKEGASRYAFTQFESTDARRAFPCFDEPAYKATYDLHPYAQGDARGREHAEARARMTRAPRSTTSLRRRRCRHTWSRSPSETSTCAKERRIRCRSASSA